MAMDKLDALLDYLEENIDEEHVRKTERLHLDAMRYGSVPRLPLTCVFKPEGVELFPYEEAFNDPEKMLYNELVRTVGGTSTYTSVLVKDDFPPHIRSNHGVGIIASLFGAECKIFNNTMPWVEHLGYEELKKVASRGVPELYQALGKKVVDTHRFYLEKLKGYPKCFRCIRITQPDLQGPFDIAELLVGGDIFLGVYDYPELLHELLSVITETYIAFRKSLDPLLTDSASDDFVYLHGCLFGGKVLIKDDTGMANLSEEMYREFSKAYNDRIIEAFGGGSMHYCGPPKDWTHGALDTPLLRGINFGNPEMHDLAKEHAYWRERRVPVLLWGDSLKLERFDRDFLDEIEKLGIRTGMTLALIVKDKAEAQSMLEKQCRYAVQ
jgi:hypothetical protein